MWTLNMVTVSGPETLATCRSLEELAGALQVAGGHNRSEALEIAVAQRHGGPHRHTAPNGAELAVESGTGVFASVD